MKKISVDLLIFLIKFLIFLKRLVAAFFVIVFKPSRSIIRFVFYQIVVSSYSFYLSLGKRLGWIRGSQNSLLIFLEKKSTQVFVTGLVAIIILANLTSQTKAGVMSEKARQTIMASLVESEFGDIEEEELIEEFADKEGITEPVKQSYLDNSATLKGEPQAMMKAPDEIEPGENIAAVTQEGSALLKPETAATKKSIKPRSGIIYYAVKPGDSVSTIAEEFSISVNTILWENNLSAYSLIRPGQNLAILPTTGVSHKVARGENISAIAKKYGVEEAKILETNKLAAADKLTAGQKLVIPGGRRITYAISTTSTYSGLSALKDLIAPPDAAPAANKMNWPTVGSRITQYFSWRHYGVDIANKIGTPIYAADAGLIEFAGWKTGYGNAIIINHGGGKKTLYGHLSKFYVGKGDKVGKGAAIAAMGSTGWSTGPHLHFEVVINGRKYNPLNYIR
ncbi:MAG: peptidoglycan DD-metalloendopeptidase family protein [Patescibacteria group bacterium]|nr:peptidoglycan DD-metalloendopeptidase family protein [Patescibacteria group bacterium]